LVTLVFLAPRVETAARTRSTSRAHLAREYGYSKLIVGVLMTTISIGGIAGRSF
jgi:hypothetical protein